MIQSRRACQNHQYLCDEKDFIIQHLRNKMMPSINEHEVTMPSMANIGISQLSVPLAWNLDQHFKSKGETRTYSMFAVLQTKTKMMDSRMVTNIDRTMTDVVFNEDFIFDMEPDDFCVEVTLYAARTDQPLNENGSSLRNKITRSLGRKFGNSVKSQLSSMDTSKLNIRGDTTIGSTNFNLMARAYLVLTDAGDQCSVHDLKMSAFADLSGPPLYGHIMCRLMVQPHSVLQPLAEGILTVKQIGVDRLLKNVRTRLQAGNLHCFVNNDIHQCPFSEETLMIVPLTSGSKVLDTTDDHTFMLATETTDYVEGSELFITADNSVSADAWKRSIKMQIHDCGIWGEFAYTPINLTFEKPKDLVRETMSRSEGSRLYDQISIAGSVSRSTSFSLHPSLSYCPRELSPLRGDAPSKRPKQRANVLQLFQNADTSSISSNDGYTKNRIESSNSYTPLSSRIDEESIGYQPISRLKHSESMNSNSSAFDFGTNRSGKKSWSRSFGAFIGKKINTAPVQVTRL